MSAWRYEISLLLLKKYFTRSLLPLVKYFSTLEEKFCISSRPSNILYLTHPQSNIKIQILDVPYSLWYAVPC